MKRTNRRTTRQYKLADKYPKSRGGGRRKKHQAAMGSSSKVTHRPSEGGGVGKRGGKNIGNRYGKEQGELNRRGGEEDEQAPKAENFHQTT